MSAQCSTPHGCRLPYIDSRSVWHITSCRLSYIDDRSVWHITCSSISSCRFLSPKQPSRWMFSRTSIPDYNEWLCPFVPDWARPQSSMIVQASITGDDLITLQHSPRSWLFRWLILTWNKQTSRKNTDNLSFCIRSAVVHARSSPQSPIQRSQRSQYEALISWRRGNRVAWYYSIWLIKTYLPVYIDKYVFILTIHEAKLAY